MTFYENAMAYRHNTDHAEEKLTVAITNALGELGAERISEEVNDLVYDITNCCAPCNNYFCLGTGAYKEAYLLNYNPALVVKFISINNKTKQEIDVYNKAIADGFGGFFVPSYYIPLFGFTVPLLHDHEENCEFFDEGDDIEDHEDGATSEEDYVANYICIQPKVAIVRDTTEADPMVYYGEEYYIDSATVIPADTTDHLGVTSGLWYTAATKTFGLDKVIAFGEWCYDNNITDLHNGNVGFYNDAAIILDWLS